MIPPIAAAMYLLPTVDQAVAQPLSAGPQDAFGRQEVRYPDGSARAEGEYAAFDASIDLGLVPLSPLAFNAVGAAAIEELVALPPGIGLRSGAATPVMIGPDAALDPAFAALPAGETPPQAKWFAEYSLDYEGVPVSKHASVLVVTDLEGEIRYVRRRGVPTLVTESVPTVLPADAVRSALDEAGLGFGPEPSAESAPRLEIWVSPENTGHLAWTFIVASAESGPPDSRRYWVAATDTPEILDWETTVYAAMRRAPDPGRALAHIRSRVEHSGQVNASVWTASPKHGTGVRPLPGIRVQRDGVPGFGLTDAAGEFHLTGGSGQTTVRARLEGPVAVVQNTAGPGLEATGVVDPGGFLELTFSEASEQAVAQLSAFYWVNRAYEFNRPILAALSDRPFADLTVRVNDVLVIGGQPFGCTAVFDESPQQLRFLRAGRGSSQDQMCPNTAYQDFVFHEYGHAVDYWRGETQDAGYSEGFGDAIAILATRQPCFGRDIFGPGTCLRDATDVDMWPPANGERGWERGKRYAQFVWELVRELEQLHPDEDAFQIATQLVLAAAAGNPSTIPDAVRLSFIANELGDQPVDPGVYCQALANAADSRGIPNPGCPRNGIP